MEISPSLFYRTLHSFMVYNVKPNDAVLFFHIKIDGSNLSHTKYRNIIQKIIYQVSSIHAFSFFASLVLTLVFQFIEMQLPTSLCLPFIDPSGSSIITKVISWVVIISQSVCSVLIAGMHILIVTEVHKLEKSVRKKSNSSKKMMSQLILISASNILCWFPTNTIYLSAMFLSTYPINLVIWTTAIIMPINSVINPCVFLLTNVKDIFKM